MAIVTGVNSTAPNTIRWASAGSDPYVRASQLAGPVENFDLHDHDSTKGLGVKRLQTTVAPTAAGHVRVNADDLQWWAATTGAVRSAVNVEGAQTVTGAKTFSAAVAVVSASADALDVGLNGATNPAFRVNASAGSQATGLRVTGQAAAAGVDVDVVSSGSNENLRLDAKGSGTIVLGTNSTGGITLTRAVTMSTIVGVGAAPASDRALYISGSTTTGTGQYGLLSAPTFSSAATVSGTGVYAVAATAAASFTMAAAYGVYVDATVKGAASTITDNYGLYAKTQTAAANGHNYNVYIEANNGGSDYSLYVAGRTQIVGASTFSAAATFNANLTATSGTAAIGGTVNLSGLVQVGAGGSQIGFYGATVGSKPTVTGSRGANAALQSLLSALNTLGLVTDSSS